MKKTIDVSLNNTALYNGLVITEVGGRKNLETPSMDEAANIVGRNAQTLANQIKADGVTEVELTGAMAVWSYLVVFHVVLHQFNKVWYNDGRNPPFVVAAHG